MGFCVEFFLNLFENFFIDDVGVLVFVDDVFVLDFFDVEWVVE